MDFGLVGCSSVPSGFGSAVSDPEANHRLYGSGLFKKQEKPINDGDDHEVGCWKSSPKMAKTSDDNDLSVSDNGKPMSVLRSSSLFSSDSHFQQQNQMLSFSSSQSYTRNAARLPCFQPSSVSPYSRNAGCKSSSNSGMYNGFTQSQWIELQHQALIYKYINANMPIPSNLLLPIRKAFESAGLSCLRSNTLGWGGFHLGFSGSTDPEPGRCRRTDGKKWRCSRDAVVDQKYCERHMNRGRHRSRKPVEGHQPKKLHGHSSAVGDGSASNDATTTNFTLSQQQHHHKGSSFTATSFSGRVFPNKNTARDEKLQATSSLSRLSTGNANLKPPGNVFLDSKSQDPCEETVHSAKFGLISSDSLLNPSSSRYSPLTSLSEAPSHNQLLQFMENWPQSHLETTQFSDFSSSMSRNNESTLSPLRLSCESDMVLGAQGSNTSKVPQSWESSIGGPLGEALHSSCQSSPTGVLQKTAFISMSNSSDGSSPRADSGRVYEGSSFCSELLGNYSRVL